MELLNERIAVLDRVVTDERSYDLGAIVHGLSHAAVVGVHGEPEVGKTTLIRAVLTKRRRHVIVVDLAAAADDGDVAGMLARGLARWLLATDQSPGAPSLSTLALPDGLRPGTATRVRAQLAHEIGPALMALALADNASDDDTVDPGVVLRAIADAAARRAITPPLLWIDHLEAPGLTPRHPVDIDKLLWTVRSETQISDLALLLSGSKAASGMAYGKRGAYYGDGMWVQIDRPGPALWGAIAERSGLASAEWGRRLATVTEGHPATTMTGLILRPALGGDPSPMDVWEHLVVTENGLSDRTLAYARQSHRLGGRVLSTIARGDGPYVGISDQAQRKEIHKVLQKLHRAGLITQPAPRTWDITNPVVASRLSGRSRRQGARTDYAHRDDPR